MTSVANGLFHHHVKMCELFPHFESNPSLVDLGKATSYVRLFLIPELQKYGSMLRHNSVSVSNK